MPTYSELAKDHNNKVVNFIIIEGLNTKTGLIEKFYFSDKAFIGLTGGTSGIRQKYDILIKKMPKFIQETDLEENEIVIKSSYKLDLFNENDFWDNLGKTYIFKNQKFTIYNWVKGLAVEDSLLLATGSIKKIVTDKSVAKITLDEISKYEKQSFDALTKYSDADGEIDDALKEEYKSIAYGTHNNLPVKNIDIKNDYSKLTLSDGSYLTGTITGDYDLIDNVQYSQMKINNDIIPTGLGVTDDDYTLARINMVQGTTFKFDAPDDKYLDAPYEHIPLNTLEFEVFKPEFNFSLKGVFLITFKDEILRKGITLNSNISYDIIIKNEVTINENIKFLISSNKNKTGVSLVGNTTQWTNIFNITNGVKYNHLKAGDKINVQAIPGSGIIGGEYVRQFEILSYDRLNDIIYTTNQFPFTTNSTEFTFEIPYIQSINFKGQVFKDFYHEFHIGLGDGDYNSLKVSGPTDPSYSTMSVLCFSSVVPGLRRNMQKHKYDEVQEITIGFNKDNYTSPTWNTPDPALQGYVSDFGSFRVIDIPADFGTYTKLAQQQYIAQQLAEKLQSLSNNKNMEIPMWATVSADGTRCVFFNAVRTVNENPFETCPLNAYALDGDEINFAGWDMATREDPGVNTVSDSIKLNLRLKGCDKPIYKTIIDNNNLVLELQRRVIDVHPFVSFKSSVVAGEVADIDMYSDRSVFNPYLMSIELWTDVGTFDTSVGNLIYQPHNIDAPFYIFSNENIQSSGEISLIEPMEKFGELVNAPLPSEFTDGFPDYTWHDLYSRKQVEYTEDDIFVNYRDEFSHVGSLLNKIFTEVFNLSLDDFQQTDLDFLETEFPNMITNFKIDANLKLYKKLNIYLKDFNLVSYIDSDSKIRIKFLNMRNDQTFSDDIVYSRSVISVKKEFKEYQFTRLSIDYLIDGKTDEYDSNYFKTDEYTDLIKNITEVNEIEEQESLSMKNFYDDEYRGYTLGDYFTDKHFKDVVAVTLTGKTSLLEYNLNDQVHLKGFDEIEEIWNFRIFSKKTNGNQVELKLIYFKNPQEPTYLIDEFGNYIVDEFGNYIIEGSNTILANIQEGYYIVDQDGNYILLN